jgi:uncharacterized membrane protein
MEDLLIDTEQSQQTKPATFSKLAFGFSMLTFICLIFLFTNILLIMRASGGHPTISKIASFLLLFSMLLGLAFSIVSLVRKEKLKYLKTIAIIINFGLLILMVASIIFNILMSSKRNG